MDIEFYEFLCDLNLTQDNMHGVYRQLTHKGNLIACIKIDHLVAADQCFMSMQFL